MTDGSPAAAGGVLVGDLLVALDGHPVESPQDLMDRLLDDSRSASRCRCGSFAAARPVDVTVTVGERRGAS